MKRRLDIGTVVALMLLMAAVTALITYWMTRQSLNSGLTVSNRIEREYEKLIGVKDYIENNYIGSWDEEALMDGAAAGMMDSLADPWSVYLNYQEYQTYLNTRKNNMVGIGVTMVQHPETGYIQVVEVFADSPAARAGISSFDLITHVDGTDVSERGYYVAIDLLMGEVNSTVALTLRKASDDSEYELSLRREAVPGAVPVRAEILDGQFGLIRIRNFEQGAEVSFREALAGLQNAGVRGLILDVRYNPGGSIDVLGAILDSLLPEGVVMSRREKNGKVVEYTSEASFADLPIVVLINEESISAAELMAAALRDFDRATLVGSPTTGKGFAQVPIELADGSGIILSTNEYYTPKGVSLAGVGLQPDVDVDMPAQDKLRFFALKPSEDVQMRAALGCFPAVEPPQQEAQEAQEEQVEE